MIDPVTSWREIRSVLEASTDLAANQVELAWVTRYPLPKKIMVDWVKKLLAKRKSMMANDNKIWCSPISTRNPWTNAIVERVPQPIGNIIPTFSIHQMDLDNKNSCERILSSNMLVIRSLLYTTTQYTLSQLVFSMDAILNINQEAKFQLVIQCKQVLINKGKIAIGHLICTALETKSH